MSRTRQDLSRLRHDLLGRPSESVIGAKMVIEMDRVPSQPAKDPPNLVRAGSFSLDRLLSHLDPGTAEESEDFLRLIYDQSHTDLSSDRNVKLLSGQCIEGVVWAVLAMYRDIRG